MRIYISADMEGISGVVHSEQTAPGAREYDRACALMLGEVNAAVAGAYEGGATAVLVNDSHWNMRNLDLLGHDPRAELISGSPKPLSMMQGIDGGFDGICFVGYHARAGTASASIDHTYTGQIFQVRVNGREVGELGLNTLLAATYSVPAILATGDQQLVAETRELLGEALVTVQVKEAIGRSAARCLPVEEARRRVRAGAREAVERLRGGSAPELLRPASPATIEVTFMKSDQAEMAALIPGSERVGARSVSFTHTDYHEVFRAWRAMTKLGA
jgi:D-amino peptidase